MYGIGTSENEPVAGAEGRLEVRAGITADPASLSGRWKGVSGDDTMRDLWS